MTNPVLIDFSEWEDSPYAQYVGVGVDETPMGEHVSWESIRSSQTWRLSYWFWLNVYRLKRRLRL